MINPMSFVDVFTGREPMQYFAQKRISLRKGVMNFALAFFSIGILLGIEFTLFRFLYGLLTGEELVAMLIGTILFAVAFAVVLPIAFVFRVLLCYVWASLHFFIAGFFRPNRGDLNEFNGSMLTVFASELVVSGGMSLVPVVGWLAAAIAHLYSLLVVFRFIKERIGLPEVQAAIIVLIPANIAMLFMVIAAAAISFILIGSKVL